MSTGDLDDLTALWRTEPEPAERKELEQLADQARRKGRLSDYADIALIGFIIVSTAVATFAAHSPLLLAAAVILILATVWLTFKRRALRQMSRSLDTADRYGFIDSSVRNVKANLRRNMLSLFVFPAIAPLALLVKMGARTGGDPHAIVDELVRWIGSARGLFTLCVLFLIMVFLVRSRQRHLAELRRLRALQHAYEDEARRDAGAEL
jgi:Flp pilus assembly protein TadB